MNYLITGGCGFIGTNFAQQLLSRGDKVTLLDNLSRKGNIANLNYLKNLFPSNLSFVHTDIRMPGLLIDKVTEEADAVYHLAGQVAVTTSVKDPREDFEINALGTFNVLESIRKSNKKPILIYASTNKVYGGMEDIKIELDGDHYKYTDFPKGIPETRLLDFHSPYGCSKGAADQYVRDYARIYDLKTVVMRQSCIYGTRQFGIEDQGWVAWFTIASVLGKNITIYGDGKQVRDVLFVEDLFNAWDLATKNIDKTRGEVFNVGGGANYTMSLLELIALLEQKLNKKIDLKFSDWRPGDQPVYVSDIAKAKNVLDWEPKVTPAAGVSKLIDWTNDNKVVVQEQLGF